MRQEQFVARHQHEWQQFEHWLQTRGDSARQARRRADPDALGDEQVPERYRRLCQQLALARRRGYSPQLTARLQQLMQRGHNLLYRTPPPRWRRAVEFLFADFPQLVRSQAGCMWAATALFAVPLVGIFVLLQYRPELIHGLLDAKQIATMERMYDPGAERLGRDSGTDWAMFGHYIMNNISIGLRTFASGLLAGLGTVMVLLFNGVTIGAVAGHLQQIGSGDPFWRFVVGHAPFELTAIVIAGGAGLQLGLKLLAPGRRRRVDALVEGGVIGARLCLGVAFMLLVAAFIEAFWSSSATVPAWIKFSVSGVLWALVLGWLWRGGRGGGDAH
ncbi:stage II sporulation protein M [Flavobacterium sp. MXW15]|uniref:Stage II sporulation protein M n=1 Tax=Xanthomonas chitinilytica TaxID=2989819 RepID=A0ABT3JZG0_9XANT|nr:stage II sporulation protein M [Xanthomonas sp. H13-6]MCW4455956.1 stage II sporulation protein M [Flavobacterium sp. MXW15]MCW4473555.1 stage II sporulation protein M [Xanthomonas sp. H13-6]